MAVGALDWCLCCVTVAEDVEDDEDGFKKAVFKVMGSCTS